MNCEPCFERYGKEVEAVRNVAGTPMCEECFRPHPEVQKRDFRGQSFALSPSMAVVSELQTIRKRISRLSKNLIMSPARYIGTCRGIQATVASAYGVDAGDLVSEFRNPPIVAARQTAIFIVRHYLRLSYPVCGKLFGGLHHTTAMHSVWIVEVRLKKDRHYRNELAELYLRATGAQMPYFKEETIENTNRNDASTAVSAGR